MASFHSFLPYLRQGLNSKLDNPDVPNSASTGARASITVNVELGTTKTDGSTGSLPVAKQVDLKGPADVTGINSNAIVKVSPANWVTNFEPNYLPYIEFFDEDFCWRYTPAAARNQSSPGEYRYRLRPWITLVVLRDEEFELFTAANGKTALRTKVAPPEVFPPQDTLWAWAHVHVNDNLAPGDGPIGSNIATAVQKLGTILDRDPDRAVSRLLSPRRLLPDTGYTAFLIPTFEAGRRAGLGLDPFVTPAAPDGAWNNGTPVGTEYPVYYQWYFKTGGAGDFESLARLLQPRAIGPEEGRRAIDLQKSNNKQLEAVAPPTPTINMQGVVQPPGAVADSWGLTDSNPYTGALRDIINKPTEILETTPGGDPIIAPPIYGRWHAARDRVEAVSGSADWLQEVNLDPRFRLYAGAGVEAVRRNQEKYMEIAWSQIGEVMEANRKLSYLQVAKQASNCLYMKHMYALSETLLINMAAAVHRRIRNAPGTASIYKDVEVSRIPTATFSGAFRRLTRPGSSAVNGVALSTGTKVTTADLILGLNTNTVKTSVPYQPPAGQINYDIWGPGELTPGFTLSLSPNQGFAFGSPGISTGFPFPVPPNTPETQTMVNSFAALHYVIASMPAYVHTVKPALDITHTRSLILYYTEPYSTTRNLVQQIIKVKNVADADVAVSDTNFVLAAPRIKIPMYKELAALSPDWIMPGLNDIAMNSVCALEINQKYIEAFMLGANYEMNRELLWRGYPTDQRGTCFSYFWDYHDSVTNLTPVAEGSRVYNLEAYKDIHDIHRWRNPATNPFAPLRALGTNYARSQPPLMVITIRGELLRKFPGTLVYLQQAYWFSPVDPRVPIPGTEVYPVFSCKIEPDIYLLGFPLPAYYVRGGGIDNPFDPGFFVVFEERTGELRFGADEAEDPIPPGPPIPTIPEWDDVTWAHIKAQPQGDGFVEPGREFSVSSNEDAVTWNWNAATVAYALRQSPVKMNIHAEGLIMDN